MKEVKGKIFVLKDCENRLINDIDTDQIFHNRYLSIVELEKMAPYALDNLEGYENFSKVVEAGMVLVAGENFGSGSSRQQAVDCFIALGVSGIAAGSFGAIYKRNTINSGLPLMEITELEERVLETGTELTFRTEEGTILDENGKSVGKFKPFSDVQGEIIEKGGLLHCV